MGRWRAGALPVPEHARRLWGTLAGDETALAPGTVTVVSDSRGICPDGWTGVVRLGDAYVIETGDADHQTISILRSLDDPSDPAAISETLHPEETLGPGYLAYLPDGVDVTPKAVAGQVEEVSTESVRAWLQSMPRDEVAESSVEDMDQLLVLRRGQSIMGVAGHLEWPADIGHIGIFVTPEARGRGVGVSLGIAATRRVLRLGRHPQWRAAGWHDASRAVAKRIGYVDVGRQFSFQA